MFKYRDASGLNAGTYYASFHSSYANGETSQEHADDIEQSSPIRNIGTNGNEGGHFVSFLDPVTSNTPKFMSFRSVQQRADTTTRYLTGSIAYNDATVMTGINFYWVSGNWESGTIKIYGVND